MDRERAIARLSGCYVTVPTQYHEDLEIDLETMRRHVRFLVDGGIQVGTGALLAGGAAGDFSMLTFDERLQITEVVVQAAGGRVAVVMGGQTTSTRELVRLVTAAGRVGAEYVQVSPPYYFAPTQGDLYEYFTTAAAAAAAAGVGLILYNTFWTSANISVEMVERLAHLPNVIGLKWAVPRSDFMEFEQALVRFAGRFCIIDNQARFVTSHMLGARAVEAHPCNYWPEWGVRLWSLLESQSYVQVQEELTKVLMPFYLLWQESESYTGGDGHMDKLCMELVGLGSSRCRPPTRDLGPLYREKARQMLIEAGVPRVV
ncbi:MAG: dihydrodipicolinate synthase family protein [Chloroflexi bacterium]|nr:dihydrodipicolinate synthase family protein [Chloroflexota bacterium]